MNKTIAIVGGVVVLAIVGLGAVLYYAPMGPAANNATSTVATGTNQTTGQTQQPGVPVVTGNSNVASSDTTVIVTG